MPRIIPTQSPHTGEQPGSVNALIYQLTTEIGRLDSKVNSNPMQILTLMDDIQAKLDEYQVKGVEVKAEIAEFENLSSQLHRLARKFIAALGGNTQLEDLRTQHHPPQNHWWWFLDQWLAEKQKLLIKKSAIQLAITLVVILVVSLLYQKFLAPDPILMATMDHQHNADSLFAAQDYAGALVEVDAALALSPDNGEMWIYRGVILENLNRLDEADQSFVSAKKFLPSEEYFYLTRASLYISLGDFNHVLADSSKAIELNPESPQAYLLNGSALQELGFYDEAATAYEKCAQLAEKANMPEIGAQAKIKEAYMIQQMNSNIIGEPPTPTAP